VIDPMSPTISPIVIPAKAGIQRRSFFFHSNKTKSLGSRPRGDDDKSGLIVLVALLVSFAVSLLAPPASAQVATDATPPQFSDVSEERRFHALVSELRCVMCQNQSLADSNAQIAHDLRREVLALMRQGKSDDEVKQFLVARYGEFVLYKPQVGTRTWLLWFGPAVLVLLGGIVIARIVRRRGAGRAVPVDDAQEW
jgi:cytochrome c-type biogenesis protein CcmH